ncbi:hypothetical protein M0R19_06685 [Candidatus Pacearchaeota archaeon]|nr:hypothetical protein [Candidatus Pacearchaeota archaeon]
MKKKVSIIFLFLLLFSLSFILAQNETNIDEKAYACLEDRVSGNCATISAEERIFSLLAIGECKSEVDTYSNSNAGTRLTALAILALSNSNSDTSEAEADLLARTETPTNMDWLLQIETIGTSSCTVSYDSNSYTVAVNSDKKLSGTNLGNCLSLYTPGNYWLKIDQGCYDKEFAISCDDSFSTNLLYKKTGSETLYVSSKTSSAAAQGTTVEKVSSFCFTLDSSSSACDYESSLWAALVLRLKGHDVSSYLPYLTAMAEDYDNLLPESFLYTLTSDINMKNSLLLKQVAQGYWTVSGSQYYDTALALLPFQNQELKEKTKTIDWLESVQGTDGCWNNGNIRDTAFLLYSIWPKPITPISPDVDDCEESGFFCLSPMGCIDAGGNELPTYGGCFGVGSVCCSQKEPLLACADQGGELCDATEQCLAGSTVDSLDSNSEKFCCLEGTCGTAQVSECETNNGFCKSSCSNNEQASIYLCTYSADFCCVPKKTSYAWIIVLLVILIILVVLGIIFRKQLKEIFFKVKAWVQDKFNKFFKKGGAKPAQGPGPRFPPASSTRPTGIIPRRIIPQQPQRPAAQQPVVKKPAAGKSDFDDVLKKLKEIGK